MSSQITYAGGYGGSFTATSGSTGTTAMVQVDFDSWTMSLSNDVAQFNTFSSRWEKAKLMQSRASGSFSGVVKYNAATTNPLTPITTGTNPTYTATGTNLTGFVGVFTLTAESGCYYKFNGVLTSADISASTGDVTRLTGNFTSDGEVVVTWDEAP